MADLSKQFDVVRTHQYVADGELHPGYVYTAFTKDGDWAGRVGRMPLKVSPTGTAKEQVQITGRGPVDVSKRFFTYQPRIGSIAVAREHRGKGLADHLANHALSDLYRDLPDRRGDTSVVGAILSPMSSSWRRKLTGEQVSPQWGIIDERHDGRTDLPPEPNYDSMEFYADDVREFDEYNGNAKAAWEAGERAPEPEGTVEDRKREFRGQ